MPGKEEEKDAKASWNRASTDTLSSGGARLVSFSHLDATHMHSLQGLGFMMPLIQESINPCDLVIVYTTDIIHPAMLYAIQGITHPWSCEPHNLFLIILPQLIHGQAPSPHVYYHPSTSHPWSGTNCYLSSIHKSSMVQATLLPHVAYQPPQIIYGSGTLLPLVSFSSIHVINGSGTIVLPVFIIHPQVIYGSGTLVPPVANLHPQVI